MAVLLMATSLQAQSDRGLITSGNLLRNYKVSVKNGTAMLMTDVPEEYLPFINNVNIPTWSPGVSGAVIFRKMLTPHLEMGYQFEYMQIRGSVPHYGGSVPVRTTGLGNNFTIGYVFRESWIDHPKTNYTLSYKVGGLTINNQYVNPESAPQNNSRFLSNLAVVTGLVNEFTFNLNEKWAVLLTAEFNRSADTPRDIYKPWKLFYHSPNAVNNFITISAGLSYQFGLIKNSKNRVSKELPWYRKK